MKSKNIGPNVRSTRAHLHFIYLFFFFFLFFLEWGGGAGCGTFSSVPDSRGGGGVSKAGKASEKPAKGGFRNVGSPEIGWGVLSNGGNEHTRIALFKR